MGSLTLTNTQQAPPPRQSAFVSPLIVAWLKAQSMKGESDSHSTTSIVKVTSASVWLANRLARTKVPIAERRPLTPPLETARGGGAMPHPPFSATARLY